MFRPDLYLGYGGPERAVVRGLGPEISGPDDWVSGSVRRLMCPFLTAMGETVAGGRAVSGGRREEGGRRAAQSDAPCFSQICSGLEPIE